MVEEGRDYPCQADCVDHSEERPAPAAALVLDGDDGADARHVEQDED